MTATDEGGPIFEAPGPGSWVLDTTHFSEPVTRFVRELFREPVESGFADGTRPYGLLLDRIEWGFVHHWPYLCPRSIAALDTSDELTRETWDRLVSSSGPLRQRLAASRAVFTERRWRADLELWESRVKPGAVRANQELAAVDLQPLGLPELAGHLERCRENLRHALYHHHRFNVAAVIAVGDFLVHAQEWTGRPPHDVLAALRGSMPLLLVAGDELAAMTAALVDDAVATELLEGDGDPGAVVAALRARPAPTGPAVRAYLERVSAWPLGSGADIADPLLGENPDVLLRTLRGARRQQPADARPGRGQQAREEAAAVLRQAVPPQERRQFDELLAEARATYRLRDERATFCDVWAFGIMRRAILATGERLAASGRIEEPVHLVEASHQEIRSMLAATDGALAAALAGRARERTGARLDDAPPVLGPPPRPPVPAAWLPPAAARTERAFRAYVDAMSPEDEVDEGDGAAVRGTAASPGRYEGPTRLIRSPGELSRVREGDVLVTRATSPAFNAVLPLLGAIVTDEGGLLSHAAIVAREYGIPAVVGAGDATARLGDGARVVVDGARGEIRPA